MDAMVCAACGRLGRQSLQRTPCHRLRPAFIASCSVAARFLWVLAFLGTGSRTPALSWFLLAAPGWPSCCPGRVSLRQVPRPLRPRLSSRNPLDCPNGEESGPARKRSRGARGRPDGSGCRGSDRPRLRLHWAGHAVATDRWPNAAEERLSDPRVAPVGPAPCLTVVTGGGAVPFVHPPRPPLRGGGCGPAGPAALHGRPRGRPSWPAITDSPTHRCPGTTRPPTVKSASRRSAGGSTS